MRTSMLARARTALSGDYIPKFLKPRPPRVFSLTPALRQWGDEPIDIMERGIKLMLTNQTTTEATGEHTLTTTTPAAPEAHRLAITEQLESLKTERQSFVASLDEATAQFEKYRAHMEKLIADNDLVTRSYEAALKQLNEVPAPTDQYNSFNINAAPTNIKKE